MTVDSALDRQRIGESIAEFIARERIPGASIGVVRGDELLLAEGFGDADIESQRPHAPELRHRIGSITKTMTGLCVMALIDEGRLSLDDRVAERLPDVRFHGPYKSLTVRHLLTHTGGIGEVPNFEDFRRGEAPLWAELDEALPGVPDAYPDGITIDVEPGTKWSYANHGWVLLGEIASRIEGAPVPEVLRRRIFEPLGMRDSDCLDHPHPQLSTGYHRAPDEDARELAQRMGQQVRDEPTVDGINIRGRYLRVKGGAAGAVQSTIPDMARYASALLDRGRAIVSPETFRAMTSPHWAPDRRLVQMGMPFFLDTVFGRPAFHHGGGVLGGWSTMLWVLPQENMGVITFMNLIASDYDVHDRLLQIVLDEPDWEHSIRPVDAALLGAAPGVFEAAPGALTNARILTGTGRVQLSSRDGELWLHARRGPWKRGARLLPSPEDPAFFAVDMDSAQAHHVALVRDGGGAVTGMRFDRLVELHRTEQVAPWA